MDSRILNFKTSLQQAITDQPVYMNWYCCYNTVFYQMQQNQIYLYIFC